MRTILARNVNDAWGAALRLIEHEGEKRTSRNGDVLVHPMPVTTMYSHPTERVLLDPARDANPMFHLHESLWMLAGRDDATWLDRFVSDFSSRFAEEGGVMHGAYGKRWRDHFEIDHEAFGYDRRYTSLDQLDEAVRLLRADPYDRQAVIQMWDASADLGVPGLKDRPCNTQIYLRCDRVATRPHDHQPSDLEGTWVEERVLDMTVCCRSNDIVFGCYGANVVHFSMLQEYLAARIGVGVGTYHQVSNNWHLYDSSRKNVDVASALSNARDVYVHGYPGTAALVDVPEAFDEEVRAYVDDPFSARVHRFENSFFVGTAQPMMAANEYRKVKQYAKAALAASKIVAPDWRQATVEWLERRHP